MQYAIEKTTNKRIDVAEALYTRDGGDYFCEVCGYRVHKKVMSKTQQPFFYHDGDIETYCTKDTWEIEEPTRWHTRMQKRIHESIPNAQPEKYLKRNNEVHRADIFIPLKQEVVIELQSSGISIENVQKRNNFYTTNNGLCLWILNTSKQCANGEINTIACTEEKRTVLSNSSLLRNVTFGRTSLRSFVCVQQNDDMFAVVIDVCPVADENGARKYTLSQSYTWNELIMLIGTNIPLHQTLAEVPSYDVLACEDTKRQRATTKNSKKYTEALSQICSVEELHNFILSKVQNTWSWYMADDEIAAILNHRCLSKQENYETWKAIICTLSEYGTRKTANVLMPYLDEEDDTEEIERLIKLFGQHCALDMESSLFGYYCARKTHNSVILAKLASHPNEQVRIAVCRNPNTLTPTIIQLSQDSDEVVRKISLSLLNQNENTTLLTKVHSAEKLTLELQELNQILNTQLQTAINKANSLQEALDQERQRCRDAEAEYTAMRDSTQQIERALERSEYQLKLYHKQEKQDRDWLSQEHPWYEWEEYLERHNIPGVFIFLIPNGRHGQELRWISVDNGETIPMHTLDYYRQDRITRSSYKWKSSYLPSNNTICRLIGYREACRLFGAKYVNASVWKNN